MSRAWLGALLALMLGCGDSTSGSPTNADGGGSTEENPDAGSEESPDASIEEDADAASEDGADAASDGGPSEDGAEPASDAGDVLPDTPERFLPAIRSGSRLKARVLKSEGADPVFVSFWDSELAVACEFKFAADGAYRCLPKLPGNSPTGHVSAQCDDDPIVVNFRPDCQEAAYLQLQLEGPAACPHNGQLSDVWSLAPATAPAAYYDGSPSFCDGPRDIPGGVSFGALGERMEPTRFVAGDLHTVRDGDALGVQVLIAEDGARRVTDPVDPRYGSCQQGVLFDVQACTPSYIAYAARDLFANDTCDEPLVVLGEPDACLGMVEVAAVIHDPTPTSAAYAEVRAIGAPLTETLYRSMGASCTPGSASEVLAPGQSAFGLEAVSLRALEAVARGEGELKTLYLARDDGVLLRPGVFDKNAQGGGGTTFAFEDASGTRCRVVRTPQGTYLCMPADALLVSIGTLFADSACSEPLASLPASATLPAAGLKQMYTLDYDACAQDDAAVAVQDIYEAGAKFEGVVYMQTGSDCVVRSDAGEVYRVGTSLKGSLPSLSLSLL